MRAAEFCELGVVKCLRTEAGTIDSQAAKRAKFLVSYTARIYLECDFCFAIDFEPVVQIRDDLLKLRGNEQRRGTTTKIDRINVLTGVARGSYLCNQCSHVPFGKL